MWTKIDSHFSVPNFASHIIALVQQYSAYYYELELWCDVQFTRTFLTLYVTTSIEEGCIPILYLSISQLT